MYPQRIYEQTANVLSCFLQLEDAIRSSSLDDVLAEAVQGYTEMKHEISAVRSEMAEYRQENPMGNDNCHTLSMMLDSMEKQITTRGILLSLLEIENELPATLPKSDHGYELPALVDEETQLIVESLSTKDLEKYLSEIRALIPMIPQWNKTISPELQQTILDEWSLYRELTLIAVKQIVMTLDLAEASLQDVCSATETQYLAGIPEEDLATK